MATIEDFTYIDAPPPVVYRLLSDLAQQPRYLPHGLRYLRALTPATDEVGARAETMVQLFGPFWRTYLLQIHAAEQGRAVVIGTPDAATFMTRWRLDPEPPGTLATVLVDLGGPGGPFGGRLETVLRRIYRELLQRLKAVAEEENPVRR